MSIEVADYLDRMGFSSDFHLVRFHCLLDPGTDFAQSSINTCFFYTSVGCILDCQQQVVVGWIECHCESSVYQSTLDMCSKIDLAHIVIGDDGVISRIRCVVGSNIIERATCRKCNTRFETFLRCELAVVVLESFANIG